ncbi:PAS domain-containing protein [Sphingomonas sp.]|uniref:PAS domain-containing protein n=1 Tax=Sphingomonas sp. TaxID=28214 RepID=UPI002DD66E29|nr:PAS domain-containing protein [Sphingomonas sp.]
MDTVSASELVRRFGAWQDRALSAPVYIRHHGRARLVLASVDFMQRLVDAPGRAHRDPFDQAQALLDLIPAMVIVADQDLHVRAMTPSAHRHFARDDVSGIALEGLLPDGIRPIVMRAVDQVCATGIVETFLLRIGGGGERRMDVTVQPYGPGVAIVGRDREETDARVERNALSDAVQQTLAVLGDVAILRINLRGFVTEATPTFGAMTGLSVEAYRSVRLATLFDIGSRAGVSDAFERAVERIEPQAADAVLLVNRGAAVPVRVGLSAEMLRSSIDAVIATVAYAR